MQGFIQAEIKKLSTLLLQIQQDHHLLAKITLIVERCVDAIKQQKKILFAGNGGSAADAQHLAAELVTRLCFERPAMNAIALTTDTSVLTAIGNDYAFENIFSRQIEAIGQSGDIFIGITTSGQSPNILRAFEAARNKKLLTVALTGMHAPLLTERCEIVLNIPSKETPKIQECHIMFGHIICSLIEETMYGEQYHLTRKQAVATA